MAGIGKTELARQFVRQLRPSFPDGGWYIDLDDYREGGAVDLLDVLGSLLDRLDVAPGWFGDSLTDRRRRYLAKTDGLRLAIIIDNARYASEVELLLPGSGTSLVVVTSHAPLSGLEAGAALEIPLTPLSDQHALELLQSAAGDPRLASDDEAALEFARLCGGLPLAIHVAACHIRKHRWQSLRDLLEGFKNDLRESGLSAASESIWDTAYKGLGSDARRLYRLLADAPGPSFTAYSAAALLGCGRSRTAVALEELEAAGLVGSAGDERASLMELLRAHAKRCAGRDGDRDELASAQRRIVSWYLRQAQLADARTAGGRLTLAPKVPPLPGVEDVPSGDDFQWLETERRVLYACVALAEARRFDTEAWSLCEPLFTHYLDHPHHADAIDAFRAGLAAAQRAEHIAAVVRMRSQLAFVYRDHGRFAEAERELERALTASRVLGNDDEDRKLKASVIEFRGRLREDQGQLDDAAADFEDALTVHEAIVNRYGEMLLYYRLGRAVARLGEPRRAADLLDRAHRMAEDLDRPRMTARTGFALADVLRGLGQPDRARGLYLESLASARARHSDFDEARVLEALAALDEETGNAAAAREHRAAAEVIRVRNGVLSR